MLTQFDHVRIAKRARIDAAGRCIAYDLDFPGHARKMLGVILPPKASFTAEGEETLEIVSGDCRVRLSEGAEDGEWKPWQSLSSGSECRVPASCLCEIETEQPVHYVRHIEKAVENES